MDFFIRICYNIMNFYCFTISEVSKMSELTQNYIEVVLPVLPLRGLVGFPAVQMNIEIARPSSLKAFTAAATLHDAKILLVAQKEINIENPTGEDMYKTGVLAEIKHVVKNPQESSRHSGSNL